MDNPVLTRWLTEPDGLATKLAEVRKAAGLSGSDMARAIGLSESRVSRIQSGKTVASGDEIRAWCRAAGTEDQIDELIGLMGKASARHMPWQQRLARGYSGTQNAYTALHKQAKAITLVELATIPSPLQTEAYATEVLRAWAALRPERPSGDLATAVAARMQRAEQVTDPARTYRFVISEAALLGGPAPAPVMVDQLNHVLQVMDLDNVTVTVLPLAPGATAIPISSFGIYQIDEGPLVIVETFHGETEYTGEDVEIHQRAVGWLEDYGVTGPQAQELVVAAINRLQAWT